MDTKRPIVGIFSVAEIFWMIRDAISLVIGEKIHAKTPSDWEDLAEKFFEQDSFLSSMFSTLMMAQEEVDRGKDTLAAQLLAEGLAELMAHPNQLIADKAREIFRCLVSRLAYKAAEVPLPQMENPEIFSILRRSIAGECIDLEKVFVAAILAAKRFAVTEEERVAIFRYAHGCASPEETQIVLRLVTERKTKICPKQSN